MSHDVVREDLRRARYAADPSYRQRVLLSQAKYEKRDPTYLLRQVTTHSYSAKRVCQMASISDSTLDRYQASGMIPRTTYPSGNRVYWAHQALWIVKLFARMRKEGWPRATPHFIGSTSWDQFFDRMRDDWERR